MENAAESANLVIAYNSLEDEIKDLYKWEIWKRCFTHRHLDILIEDRDSLPEDMKDTYDRMISTYHQHKTKVKELHLKANNLKRAGLIGKLIDEALRSRVDSILESRIPECYRELPCYE